MITAITYTAYFCLAALLTVLVGRDLHNNGYYLILDLFHNELFTKTVNNMLLTGYYLVNIGFVAITVGQIGEVDSLVQAIERVSFRIGSIALFLGVLHFNNIIVLHLLSKRKTTIINFINN
jgi:hypothetical protein